MALPEVCILNFHGLGRPQRALPKGEEQFWLEPSFFESILDLVRSRPQVHLTFDDSNSSDFTLAFPALVNRGMRATFFAVSERIDAEGFLKASQLREMSRAGMRVGSHGAKHRPWAQLSKVDLDEELKRSRQMLEALLGQTVDEAACPFGSYNRRVLRSLRASGYTRVYTSDDGPARLTDWLLPRNTIERTHDLCHVKRLLEPRSILAALFHRFKIALKRAR